ncbi:MAG: hypothetical protein AAF740_13135 [Bacteroidota bacterium]
MKKIAILFTFFLVACGGNESISTEEFDYPAWKNDKNGCSGTRLELWENLKSVKERLIGLSEVEVLKVLGTPDNRDLYNRNQKAVIYYLEPAPSCESFDENTPPRVVRVLFNALNQAKEITIVVDDYEHQ